MHVRIAKRPAAKKKKEIPEAGIDVPMVLPVIPAQSDKVSHMTSPLISSYGMATERVGEHHSND